jgi:hypothetical protein
LAQTLRLGTLGKLPLRLSFQNKTKTKLSISHQASGIESGFDTIRFFWAPSRIQAQQAHLIFLSLGFSDMGERAHISMVNVRKHLTKKTSNDFVTGGFDLPNKLG